MKIAIPTNDGLSLCNDFGQAKGFLVLTVQLGEITREELRWNKLSDILCSPDGLLVNCHDCDAVMANRIGAGLSNLLAQKHTEIIKTTEEIITNAYIHYLDDSSRKEVNTCCCP
jgi:predicted Fe-Mo cluster-binding NifX family protein